MLLVPATAIAAPAPPGPPSEGKAESSSALTLASGTPWAWGANNLGQLGDDSLDDRSVPVQVSELPDVVALSEGTYAGYALLGDGTVWAWGSNENGQLGNGGTENSSVPVQVSGLTDIAAVSGGEQSAYALGSDGTVWAWGYNGEGQLGNDSTTGSLTPVQVSGLTDVISIAGGDSYSAYALRADGTVWSWGENSAGQLGSGSEEGMSTLPVQVSGLDDVTAIGAGWTSAYAVRADGSLWGWGYNGFGELGDGTTEEINRVPVEIAGLSGVQAVAAGVFTGYALLEDGTVRAWGANTTGQLGDGTTTNSSTPVQVSGLTGVRAVAGSLGSGYALLDDGTVWAWGFNMNGQLGNGTQTDSAVPVQVSGLTGVISIAAGDSSAYALVADPGCDPGECPPDGLQEAWWSFLREFINLVNSVPPTNPGPPANPAPGEGGSTLESSPGTARPGIAPEKVIPAS